MVWGLNYHITLKCFVALNAQQGNAHWVLDWLRGERSKRQTQGDTR